MSGGGVVLLLLTLFTWVILALVLRSVVGVDAPGDRDIFLGLRWIFAYLLICALWLWLGCLTMSAGSHDVMPKWMNLAAVALLPIAAITALIGLYLVERTETRWPLVAILAVPLFVALYLFSLFQPPLRALTGGTAAAVVVCGIVLAMSIPVFPALSRRLADNARETAERAKADEEQARREKQRIHDENLAKLQAMRPDQDLTEWYTLLDPESGVRDETLAAMRKVDRLQGDIEEGLGDGIPRAMGAGS